MHMNFPSSPQGISSSEGECWDNMELSPTLHSSSEEDLWDGIHYLPVNQVGHGAPNMRAIGPAHLPIASADSHTRYELESQGPTSGSNNRSLLESDGPTSGSDNRPLLESDGPTSGNDNRPLLENQVPTSDSDQGPQMEPLQKGHNKLNDDSLFCPVHLVRSWNMFLKHKHPNSPVQSRLA